MYIHMYIHKNECSIYAHTCTYTKMHAAYVPPHTCTYIKLSL